MHDAAFHGSVGGKTTSSSRGYIASSVSATRFWACFLQLDLPVRVGTDFVAEALRWLVAGRIMDFSSEIAVKASAVCLSGIMSA